VVGKWKRIVDRLRQHQRRWRRAVASEPVGVGRATVWESAPLQLPISKFNFGAKTSLCLFSLTSFLSPFPFLFSSSASSVSLFFYFA
jgi:hypothetical protein